MPRGYYKDTGLPYKAFNHPTPEDIKILIKNNKKRTGNNHPRWKGDNIGYDALHIWIQRKLGRAKKCVDCGKRGFYIEYIRNNKPAKRWNIEWSNIDHKYKRNLEEYVSRCIQCHRKYDKKFLM